MAGRVQAQAAQLMHQYGGEGTSARSAVDASVRLDVSTGRIDASVWQEGYNHGEHG